MALKLVDVTTRAYLLTQDAAPTIAGTPDMVEAARQALAQYSLDSPRSAIADITGDGSSWDFPVPTGYIDGQSRVVAVEYPAGERIPVLVDPTRLAIYKTPVATTLRFLDLTLANGVIARVTFSVPHTLEGLDNVVETTIPAWHEEAFVTLVAAQAFFLLAARFLHEQENTIGVDTVSRASKSEEASRQGRALLASYRTLARVTAKGPAAAGRVQWGTEYATGVSRLTHGRGLR